MDGDGSEALEVHRVETEYCEKGGYYWQCSCGHGGSGPDESRADLHSDEHIPATARRIDVQQLNRW